jgi:hypothetical protein
MGRLERYLPVNSNRLNNGNNDDEDYGGGGGVISGSQKLTANDG